MHTHDGVAGQRSGHAVLVVMGTGALLAARLTTPAQSVSGPILCPFRLLTGIPCPACGLTRSWVHVAHGQWSEAFTFHALGPAFMMLAIAGILLVAAHWATRRWWVPPRYLGATLVVLSVATGAWWVVRGITAGWSA